MGLSRVLYDVQGRYWLFCFQVGLQSQQPGKVTSVFSLSTGQVCVLSI